MSTAGLAACVGAGSASGALLGYEGFDYAAGSFLAEQNGGIGFSQPWQANIGGSGSLNNSMIVSGSFGYTDLFGNSLVTSGNRAHITGDGTAEGDDTGGNRVNGQPLRGLSFARGVETQTTWISVLALRTGLPFSYVDAGGEVLYGRGTSLQLFSGTGSERLTIGRASQNSETDQTLPNDTWALVNRGAAGFTRASDVNWTEEVAFLLIRIDHQAGDDITGAPDTAYMWVNPPNLLEEPSIGDAQVVSFAGDFERDYSFDTLRFFAGGWNSTVGYGSMEFDEIRIGELFADVTPVPEPSAMALLGLGLISVLWRMRRK